jgi:tight adherence protein C
MVGLLGFIAMALMAALSVGCLLGGGLMLQNQNRIDRRLRDIQPLTLDGDAATGWRRLSALANDFVLPGQDQEEIQKGLRAAGFYDPDAVAMFGVTRLLAGLFVAAGAILLLVLTHKWAGFFHFLPLIAAGAVILMAKPFLAGMAARRARKINAEMPFTLDVLLMMLESGVSLDQCFRTFAQSEGRAAPEVRKTVEALVEDLQRGMAYDMALHRWSDRLGVMGARELAGVFRQALAHGSELSTTLRQFALQFAETRVSTARESIGKKTVQMTLAMMLFLMPALMIVLVGPAVHNLLTALKHLN